MKPPRKRTRSPLPPAPLELAYPLSVERGEVGGAVLVSELPREYALPLWRTYRLVLSLARVPGASHSLDPAELAAWEQHVLEQAGVWDADVWSGVAAITTAAGAPADVDTEWVAFTCTALADWCVEHDAPGAAVSLAEAAALVAPANPRFAYLAGRMYRGRGNYRDAEHWLERSRRVAVWKADREAQSIALNGLGNLYQQMGRYPRAEELLLSALRTARRARITERIPFIYHDLLVVAVYTGNLAKAGEYAREALEGYPPGHPNVPKLAHDVAWLWFQHGRYAQSLRVFEALLLYFTDPEPRLHVLGYAARAAGATGDAEGFSRYWDQAWGIMDSGADPRLQAAAALELGYGAVDISRWDDADRALRHALANATLGGDNETVVKASAALERLGSGEQAERTVPPGGGRVPRGGDLLARELATVLVTNAGRGNVTPDVCGSNAA